MSGAPFKQLREPRAALGLVLPLPWGKSRELRGRAAEDKAQTAFLPPSSFSLTLLPSSQHRLRLIQALAGLSYSFPFTKTAPGFKSGFHLVIRPQGSHLPPWLFPPT